MILLTLLGFALRLPLLARFPLREDEAIYGYWALHGLTVDPLFLHVWPDKPPLFLWLQGLAFTLWGHGPATAEPAARLVNIFASTLTIPVLAVTARRWWGPTAALVTALLAALNPFAISFAPTAFTDPVLVLAGSLALACAAGRRPFWSGLWLGAAIMTKQQGVLFAPLVVGVLLCPPVGRPPVGRPPVGRPPVGRPRLKSGASGMQNRLKPVGGRARPAVFNRFQPVSHSASRRFQPAAFVAEASRFLAGLALITLPILYWDSLRWSVAPSPWDLGAANVGGVQLADLATWDARTAGWMQPGWSLLASPWAWGVYASALLGAAVLSLRRRSAVGAPPRDWLPALLPAGWAVGFLLLHIVTSVQVWDRYLLPLTVPLVLLGGWAAGTLAARSSPVGHASSVTVPAAHPTPVGHASSVTVPATHPTPVGHASSVTVPAAIAAMPYVLVIALVLPPAWSAAQGRLPIGGDHGAYSGLEAALAAVTPTTIDGPHTLLFHRELGWHARFALFEAVQSGAVELRYYPSSTYLADSATKSPHKDRYVIVPDWGPLPDLRMQLAMRGLQADTVLRAGHFTVYRIDERPTGDQSWRVCAP